MSGSGSGEVAMKFLVGHNRIAEVLTVMIDSPFGERCRLENGVMVGSVA